MFQYVGSYELLKVTFVEEVQWYLPSLKCLGCTCLCKY